MTWLYALSWSLCLQKLVQLTHCYFHLSCTIESLSVWFSFFQTIGAWSRPESAQSTPSASRWVVVLFIQLCKCTLLFLAHREILSASLRPVRWLWRRCLGQTWCASTSESIWSPLTSQWLSSWWLSGDASSCRRRRPFSCWRAQWCQRTGACFDSPHKYTHQ